MTTKLMLPALLYFFAFIACGCVTNGATFSEKLADAKTGVVTSDTTIKVRATATWGSELKEGMGDVSYKGTGKNPWVLTVGQSAKGLQAGGDPVQMFKEVRGLIADLKATPSPVPDATITPPPDITLDQLDTLLGPRK